ncbi:MAG TPA: cyclic nucleotide-binding domain-containing protein [Chthoniobacteraceae bacterium]|nr:cyclic nucleotide-binding domain-containing protein [Chthoniobacteraceae bacterium]
MISLLENVPIFAGLQDEALELLLDHAVRCDHATGEVVVREGEASNLLFLIGSGSVRVIKNFGAPNAMELTTLTAKDFFGEMCIIDTLPRMATVVTGEPSVLFSISTMAFHRLYQKMPAQHSILILNIARDLARRLRRLDEVFAASH